MARPAGVVELREASFDDGLILSGILLTRREVTDTVGTVMSEHKPHNSLSRREALKIIAGSVGVAMGCPTLKSAALCGKMQDLALRSTVSSSPYSPKFFTPEEMQTLDGLSEMIIPEDGHSPGAHAARVNQYMEEVMFGSSQGQKLLWQNGLAALDKMAELEQGKKFRDCSREQQRSLVERISEHEDHPTTLEEQFFVAVKKSSVEGYYTSEIGIHQELEYQGNDVLLDFEGCKHEGHKS